MATSEQAKRVVTEWIEHGLDESVNTEEISVSIEQRRDLIERIDAALESAQAEAYRLALAIIATHETHSGDCHGGFNCVAEMQAQIRALKGK